MENKITAKTIIKKGLFLLLTAFITMWIFFWYISGSAMGLFKFVITQHVATTYFMDPIDKRTVFEGALKGMIEALNEPHSRYLPEEEFKNIMMQTESAYTGVGIILGQKKQGIEIISAIDDSPAAKAGIKSGDIIIAIDGESTENMVFDKVGEKVRGTEGSTVVLRTRRGDTEEDYELVRQKISLPTVKERMIEGNIGYIRISHFAEKTGEDFAAAYEKLNLQNMEALVVDLRNNPGGLLTTAQETAHYLVPQGPVVSVQNRAGRKEVYESQGLGKNIPLVILVNEGSASASEIIAGAVQDLHAGTIVGTTTYGKGTVQSVIPAGKYEAIKITIAKYHTPADRVIDGIGIEPDVIVDLPENVINESEDAQLQKALDILRN